MNPKVKKPPVPQAAPEEWSVSEAASLYGVDGWGDGYVGVSERGTVTVHPGGDPTRGIDLFDVVQGLETRGIGAPVVVRFPALLDHRLRRIRTAFDDAIAETGYTGGYRCVYPIKVNQQRSVCEEVARFGESLGFGFEAGSKPELLLGLELTRGRPGMPLVCNGFKDDEFIEMAILAAKMGRNVVPVVERYHELELLVKYARAHDITPRFGIRAKLGTGGVGRWSTSTGFRGKFGLSMTEIVTAVDYVRAEGLLDGLVMLHAHVGSQIFDIRTVKNAVAELVHLYAELVRLGAPMGVLDLGGGLGVDYDGTRSASDSSMNYTMEQYALDVVQRVRAACDEAGVAHPDLVTESGRAMVAHSSLLVCEVLGARTFPDDPDPALLDRALSVENPPQPLLDIVEAYQRLEDADADPVELHSDAMFALTEAHNAFNLGFMDLPTRAAAEELYCAIGSRLLALHAEDLPEDLEPVAERLADLYFVNFSLFQSLIDAWGIGQVFPIMPVHRLNERPTRRAVLADITCDSDGRIDCFPSDSGPRPHLDVHELRAHSDAHSGKAGHQAYYLAVFLVGAYQETLGDLHNLFGDTHTVLVEQGESGEWRLEEVNEGETVRDVLRYVQFDTDQMRRKLRKDVEKAHEAGRLTLHEAVSLQHFLDRALHGYTYLEEPRITRARRVSPTRT